VITVIDGVLIEVTHPSLPLVVVSARLWKSLGFADMPHFVRQLCAVALIWSVASSAPRSALSWDAAPTDGISWFVDLPMAGEAVARAGINGGGEAVFELSLPEENTEITPALQAADVYSINLRSLRSFLRQRPGERQ